LNSHEEIAGFVLAGGRSSRMGRDKALVPFAGRPLIVNALSILRQAGLSGSIAGGRSELVSFAPVIEDAAPGPGLGPLSGVCGALASLSTRLAVFLAVDQPLLPPSLIRILVDHARTTGRPVTVPAVNGVVETFPAVLDRAVLPALEAQLATRRLGCLRAFEAAAGSLNQPVSAVEVELLAQAGQIHHPLGLPPARWFLNVNTPSDLRLASRHASGPIA
jgi:molybdenum cofactor guanylyltransferase